MENDIKKSIKDFYSSDKRIKRYLREGLTPLEKKIFNTFEEKGKLLDVCCGAGRVVLPLQERGFDVFGIDLTSEMLASAKKSCKSNFKSNLVVADAAFLPFKDDTFEYSIMLGSLEVIPRFSQRKMVLFEMIRVLKRGGRLFVHTCNLHYLGKFGYRLFGLVALFLLDTPVRLWHTLKGEETYGFGDVRLKSGKVSPFHHSVSKSELLKILKPLKLREHQIFYTFDIVTEPINFKHSKFMSKFMSPDIVLIGRK